MRLFSRLALFCAIKELLLKLGNLRPLPQFSLPVEYKLRIENTPLPRPSGKKLYRPLNPTFALDLQHRELPFDPVNNYPYFHITPPHYTHVV